MTPIILLGQNQPENKGCFFEAINQNQQFSGNCNNINANPCDCQELSGSTSQVNLDAFPSICFNIHIVIENSVVIDNQFPYTFKQLNETITQLNRDFAIAKISFNLVEITELNQGESLNSVDNPNAFEVYIENSMNGWGRAGEGNYVRLDIIPFLTQTPLVSHEFGHVFGLAHTQGGGNESSSPGNWYDGGNTGNNCERVAYNTSDPDNGICTGDFVSDTNPVPNFKDEHRYELAEQLVNNGTYSTFEQAFSSIAYSSSQYTHHKYLIKDTSQNPPVLTYDVNSSPITNCHGEKFTTVTSADATNFMAYSDRTVPGNFTTGQAIRMQEFIDMNYSMFDEELSNNKTYDLMIANSEDDYGFEPDHKSPVVTNSPDIWVRNQPDGLVNQTHQDLEYIDDQTPVYVYVKVTNRSCETTTGNDLLNLYWPKGGLFQEWDETWIGLNPEYGMDTGGEIDTQNIPILDSGESTILEFPWFPGNPSDYLPNLFTKPWMFCFLARIISVDDPMTQTEISYPSVNTRENNNIAYKNTTVIDVSQTLKKGSILAGNLGNDESVISDIRFFTLDEANHHLWEQAEVRVELDDTLWTNWMDSGGTGIEVEIVDEENHIILVNNNSRLRNIPFGANETGILTVGVNFLIDEVEEQERYELQVEQIHSGEQFSMGGFTYVFLRNAEREEFNAEGERERNNNITTLKTKTINEQATYNWYNENDKLVYSGEQLIVTDPIAKEYKLEIIADSDGHKDYTSVNSECPFKLESISPNPASSQIQICYLTQGANSSYISITSLQAAINNNYILNNTQSDITIDVSTYNTGIYIVTLVCDGQVIESKNLVIQ